MLFSNDRHQLRQFFFDSWNKHLEGKELIPLESMIVQTLLQHPEYHHMLSQGEQALHRDYSAELGQTNPFLHLGLHIAIHEQLSTQRPAGIVAIYQNLIAKFGSSHEAEHQMMESLGEMFWKAQQENRMPDEQDYVRHLRQHKLGLKD